MRIFAEPIPIPPPSRSKLVATVVAMPTLRSASSIVEEFTTNWVPSTYKSPFIRTKPVLSPTPAGSIITSDGPLIVFWVTLIPTPEAPVENLVDAVTIPEIKASPTTWKFDVGLVVPIPRPVEVILAFSPSP